MGYTLIRNAAAILDDGVFRRDILLRDEKIADTDFRGELPPDCAVIDAEGAYAAPGFIDIHLHGGGGFDLMDCTEEAFRTISAVHLKNGTTSMIPTTVSSDFADILRVFDAYRKYAPACPNFCGLHLEGPFLSAAMKGAHKEKFLHAPTPEETAALLEGGRGILRRITAAPELDGMDAFARAMREAGVVLSIGHSDAVSEEALWALENGFSLITHMYNMTTTTRKVGQKVCAGVAEAAYLTDSAVLELIGDGKHVARDAFRLAVKIKGTDRVCMVSDALSPAGTDAKESYLGEKIPENRVIIEDGVAKLPDRTRYAGSIATTAMMLERGVNFFGFSVADTVRMLTASPAAVMGLSDRGHLKEGLLADLVLFGEDLKLRRVLKNGRTV